MKGPLCRVTALGTFSTWGRQFMNLLQGNNILDIGVEPSFDSFLKQTTERNQIVFIENSPDSRKNILKLRKSDRPFFIVWMGLLFTKEDHIFALDQRIYCVFENIKHDDKYVLENIQKIAKASHNAKELELVVRSLKAVLLDLDGDIVEPMLMELKTAAGRIDELVVQNEFSGQAIHETVVEDSHLFHKSEDLVEAMATIHNLERTGILLVGSSMNLEGRIEFIQGRVVSASTGTVKGLKALYRMFLWDNSRFVFCRRRGEELLLDEQIPLSVHTISLEGAALKRRFEKIRSEIPPSELNVDLDPLSLHEGSQLQYEDFHTLASVVEYGKVGLVLDYNPLPDVAIYESLINLRKDHKIRVLV